MWSRADLSGRATHQVDAVGVHAAQRPPAQVRVVVPGVGLHTAGLIGRGAADEENGGQSGPPCLAGSPRNVMLLLISSH